MEQSSLTIAKAAEAAAVGVETIRYYERRGLIAQPTTRVGSYRTYDSKHVARIRFIKRAQELGFTLEEIESLLTLEDGTDRRSIRAIAAGRLEEIRDRIADLKRMEKALSHVLHKCEAEAGRPRCPIIEAISPAETARESRGSGRSSGASRHRTRPR
jgi:MerR family mercuric resistance operon transcriptional regulator